MQIKLNPELFKELNKKAEEFTKLYQVNIPEFISPLKELELNEFFDNTKLANQELTKVVKQLGSSLQRASDAVKYFENNPDDFTLIASYGWFLNLDPPISLIVELAGLIKKKEYDSINNRIADYFRSNLEYFINGIKKSHPNRSRIFSQLHDAYVQTNYALVVPVILSQIDGVCLDAIGIKFFEKDKKNGYRLSIASRLELKGKYYDHIMKPIFEKTPIMSHQDDLKKFPCKLNRHRVLHGEDDEYDTEMNCLKCFSLLIFISDILKQEALRV